MTLVLILHGARMIGTPWAKPQKTFFDVIGLSPYVLLYFRVTADLDNNRNVLMKNVCEQSRMNLSPQMD